MISRLLPASLGERKKSAGDMTQKTITHWIDGKSFDRPAERHGDVYNPATGQVQAKVAFATPSVVDEAVESAWKAAQTWRSVSIARRTKILFAFRQLVDKHQHDLAHLLTLEHGKVTGDALGEVNRLSLIHISEPTRPY